MLKEITIKTNTQTQILDITAQVQKVVGESGIEEGLCCVFVPCVVFLSLIPLPELL
jgi:thiamine phosphate synthase YjbQ (UPF0047 family)